MYTTKLNQDDLLRLIEIIPSDQEVKSLKGLEFETLHDSEKCLFQLGSVHKIATKVILFYNSLLFYF